MDSGEQQADTQEALLAEARRQTKAQESIVNLLWFLAAVTALGAIMWFAAVAGLIR